jgi:hypothetical protein
MLSSLASKYQLITLSCGTFYSVKNLHFQLKRFRMQLIAILFAASYVLAAPTDDYLAPNAQCDPAASKCAPDASCHTSLKTKVSSCRIKVAYAGQRCRQGKYGLECAWNYDCVFRDASEPSGFGICKFREKDTSTGQVGERCGGGSTKTCASGLWCEGDAVVEGKCQA